MDDFHQRLHGTFFSMFFLPIIGPTKVPKQPTFVNNKSSDVHGKNAPCYPWFASAFLIAPLSCCSELYSTARVVGVGERLSDGLTLAGFMCPSLCFLSSLIVPSAVPLLCRSCRSETGQTVCVPSPGRLSKSLCFL